MPIINSPDRPFKVQAFKNGEFIEIAEQDRQGHGSALVFMPAAFTFDGPTEVEDVADNDAAFQRPEAEIDIVTTGSHFAHEVRHETSPAVGKARFRLVGDPTHPLTRMFGVHIEADGLALRGTFLIDPEGVVEAAEIHDNGIARVMKETLRKLKAAQCVAKDPGPVRPAKWNEGAKTLTSSPRSTTAAGP